MREILNEYFASMFTVEKDMDDRERGKTNSDILKNLQEEKDGKEKPGNYRPVNLTSVVGKLLERVLKDKVYMYLEWQDLIMDGQHGFVHGKSYLTNLTEFSEEVTKKVNEGRVVDVIYIDF
eukprot:g38263.t1